MNDLVSFWAFEWTDQRLPRVATSAALVAALGSVERVFLLTFAATQAADAETFGWPARKISDTAIEVIVDGLSIVIGQHTKGPGHGIVMLLSGEFPAYRDEGFEIVKAVLADPHEIVAQRRRTLN